MYPVLFHRNQTSRITTSSVASDVPLFFQSQATSFRNPALKSIISTTNAGAFGFWTSNTFTPSPQKNLKLKTSQDFLSWLMCLVKRNFAASSLSAPPCFEGIWETPGRYGDNTHTKRPHHPHVTATVAQHRVLVPWLSNDGWPPHDHDMLHPGGLSGMHAAGGCGCIAQTCSKQLACCGSCDHQGLNIPCWSG